MTFRTPSHPPGRARTGRYIAFWKPYGVLSQFTPEAGHPALDGFRLPKGVYPVGRLDRDSEGLLLLSDDGRFIKRLLEPRFGHPRRYLAQVENVPDEAALDALRAGVVIGDYRTRPCLAERLEAEPDLPPREPPIRYRANIPTAWLRLTLTEGKNRQVRRMTAAVGHPTLRLVREAIGRLTLEGLRPGQWREIGPDDVLEPAKPRR